MRFQLTTLLLPALALALPTTLPARDAEPGCQDASFNGFAWTIESFRYHASYVFSTPAHQNSWGYVDFNLTNAALSYQAQCSASSSQLNDFFFGDQAYTCTVPAGSSAATTFSFSRPEGRLGLNQTWTCSDKDPQFPTRITGYGIQDLDLDCTDVTVQNQNWTIGQIYSTRTVECQPQTFVLKPERMNAVA